MDKQNIINKLIAAIKESRDIVFAKECLNNIEGGLLLFNSGSSLAKDHVYKVYKNRYSLQQNVTNAVVEGYETVLERLKNFIGDKVCVMTLTSETNGYIIFSDKTVTTLIGILKTPYTDLKDQIEINRKNEEEGSFSNSVIVSQGKIIQ